jgi:lipopolysaccharide transport system permease protein
MRIASDETGRGSPPSVPVDADVSEAAGQDALRGADAARAPRRVSTPRAAGIGLVWTLVRTDFKARYHGTLGGFVWALLKPLAMFAVLMGVFSFLFPDPFYKVNLIVGLFLWDFFAEGTKVGLTSLQARAFLLTKARCPTWILVVTSISNAVITLAVFYLIITGFLVVVGRTPTVAALVLFVLYGAALISIVVAFSLAASVLFLRYRDLNQVWDVVVQAGFFFAPIIYPLGVVPERFHFYFYLWPPTPILEFSRAVLITGAVPTPTAHVYLAIDVAFSLLLGIMIFRRFAPRAAEFL